jgi:hypothetical protein
VGSSISGTERRGVSSPDNDETGQYCLVVARTAAAKVVFSIPIET